MKTNTTSTGAESATYQTASPHTTPKATAVNSGSVNPVPRTVTTKVQSGTLTIRVTTRPAMLKQGTDR